MMKSQKPMENEIIAYKGMDKNMQCRGMQYAVGEEFAVDGEIECCGNGLHACERPLDVFNYYAPGGGSRYFRVSQSGDLARGGGDSEIASRKMRVDAEIGIPGLVRAHVEYVKAHTTTEHTDPERATAGDSGAATAGDRGAATAGNWGAATAGNCGAATAGDRGAADVVQPQELWVGSSSKRRRSDGYTLTNFRDQKRRAKTFPGIARAMAEQWGV